MSHFFTLGLTPCVKFRIPCLGKAAAAARAGLRSPAGVCGTLRHGKLYIFTIFVHLLCEIVVAFLGKAAPATRTAQLSPISAVALVAFSWRGFWENVRQFIPCLHFFFFFNWK